MNVREQILEWVERDREPIIQFLSRFVAKPSPNPPGDTRDKGDKGDQSAHGKPPRLSLYKLSLASCGGSA